MKQLHNTVGSCVIVKIETQIVFRLESFMKGGKYCVCMPVLFTIFLNKFFWRSFFSFKKRIEVGADHKVRLRSAPASQHCVQGARTPPTNALLVSANTGSCIIRRTCTWPRMGVGPATTGPADMVRYTRTYLLVIIGTCRFNLHGRSKDIRHRCPS